MEAMEAELEVGGGTGGYLVVQEAEVAAAAEVNNTTKPEETCRQCSVI